MKPARELPAGDETNDGCADSIGICLESTSCSWSYRLKNISVTLGHASALAVAIAAWILSVVCRLPSHVCKIARLKSAGAGIARKALLSLAYEVTPPQSGATSGKPEAIASSGAMPNGSAGLG